jgi:outer membrane immunogenic protein
MKKIILTLTALAAFSGSAIAADMPARAYKAPAPIAPVYNWTGFYVFGGGGGGVWDANGGVNITGTGTCIICTNTRTGGDGWFGTVGAGYDWQANSSWVFGVFADGQFGSLKGNIGDAGVIGIGSVTGGIVGTIKNDYNWAAGARLGWLVAPNVLSYVNAGYTGTHWSGSNLLNSDNGNRSGLHTNGFNTGGAFVGGGVENSLNFFGISSPGWFMKTEYRAAYLNQRRVTELTDAGNVNFGRDIMFGRTIEQTISTSLVYRFNWGGPVVAKY